MSGQQRRAAVIGAGGAIGRALVERLAADERYDVVYAFSREERAWSTPTVRVRVIDIHAADSVAAAARSVDAALDLVLIATGMLHEGARGPERALRDLDPDWLARSFAVNTIGPALVIQHFAPLLPRERRGVIAALSARVGSISDNRLGGWYGYRAAKAALNMIVRCAAIEIARSRPQAICVGLHPGTVDSALSRPFQGRVAPEKLFTPDQSAGYLLAILAKLEPANSGGCFAWDGSLIDP